MSAAADGPRGAAANAPSVPDATEGPRAEGPRTEAADGARAEADAPPAPEATATPSAPHGAIRDLGYQRYTGTYTPPSGRWRLIASRALRIAARQPWVIAMLILAIFPTLIAGVIIWIQSRVVSFVPAGGALPPLDRWVLDVAMRPWGVFLLAFLVALFAGAGQIADDTRTGAFQLYFARPVTREHYLAGKLAAVTALVFFVGGVPPLLLALLRVALASDGAAALGHVRVVAGALALGLVEAPLLAAPALALSSLARSRGYTQGGYATLVLLPWMLGAIFVNVTRSPWAALLSLPTHLDNLGHWLYGVEAEGATLPVWLSALVLALVLGGALALLRRRLAAVDVIAS